MTHADLPAIAAEMLGVADARPWNPAALRVPAAEYSRWLDLEGYHFRLTLTRTNVPGNSLYMLSILDPALLPERLIQAVRLALLPASTDIGEEPLSISRKFVQRID